MYLRVLVVGRCQDTADAITSLLESNGYIVATALSDATATDLVLSSEFDAVVATRDVKASDRGYLRTQVLKRNPSTVFVAAQHPNSVLTQLNQAFKEMGNATSA